MSNQTAYIYLYLLGTQKQHNDAYDYYMKLGYYWLSMSNDEQRYVERLLHLPSSSIH